MSKVCKNCNSEIMDEAVFCPNCGKPVSEVEADIVKTALDSQEQIMNKAKKLSEPKGFAIASMVIGIVSLVCCCRIFGAVGMLISLVGLVFGIISLAKKQGGKGMAIAGIICCSIGLILSSKMAISHPHMIVEIQKGIQNGDLGIEDLF